VLETQGVGLAVRAVNDEVKDSAVALKATLGSLNAKLKTGATVMDSVVQMAERHHALLATAEKQAETYSGFLDRMSQIEQALSDVVKTAGITNEASGQVLTRMAGLAADSASLREAIRTSLSEVAAQNAALGEAVSSSVMKVSVKLEDQSLLTGGLLARVDQTALRIEQGSGNVVMALNGHAEQLIAINVRLEGVVSCSQGLSSQLQAVVASNEQLLDSSRKRLEGVERAAAHSESIVVSLAELNPLLSRQVEALQASCVHRAMSSPTPAPMHGGAASTSGGMALSAEGWRAGTQGPQPEPQPGQGS